ncbi:MAG: Siderophore biosynthesis non-ribosomal peptide synthetase modules [uncultured Sulfurovum sp.]|uniref:Siderophore biosynthesis non-ribosomal peptide synthetase modules n=1 Tax=uncultured Sulfurovum sp. TaxID=269237 RepID=A0A6S6SGI7_9BACT|nr:MAG: Siderophore biosynthesis non-ribosomal peptide synthetase modules [uncultured Sulfurovum sp.]
MNKKIIHTVFEKRVIENPDKIAVVYGEKSISYKVLNEKANTVAHSLDKDEYVALFFPNSMDYVIAMLGVLKAGSFFVPIDVLAPTDRIAKITKKAHIKRIITNLQNLEKLQEIVQLLVLDVEIMVLENLAKNSSNVSLQSKENDTAYLMFTSGSTGEPKAIVGMQKSLSHFIHWECKEFAIDETFKIVQLAGVTFDVSLRDIFTALISGATLHIPLYRDDISYLAGWISEQSVNLIHIVPSLFRLLVKEFEFHKHDLKALKHILLAGEALYGNDVLDFYQAYPHIELVNLYGPSETTLAKIFNRIKIEDVKDPNMIIPLGKPISNTAVLILKNQKLVQTKQIGEIYIKTPFRSKGYLGDKALSKKVFIQNPLNEEEDILYKTGDMGRYQEDGTIEFIGRTDRQVKINGIRVELEEIERTIKNYEMIQDAMIVSEVSSKKELVIICYFIAKKGLIEDEVRDYLLECIPSYMVPNFFVEMEKFPLNFHGKIDKRALPKPEDLIYVDRGFIEPLGDSEKVLAKIFSEVLNVTKISSDISFTDLGGNSLMAISVTAKISQQLNVQINIKDFFENQNVQALAKVIEAGVKQIVSIEKIVQKDNYQIANSQRRLWVLDKIQENFTSYNISGAIEFDGILNQKILKKSLVTLINRHEILRTNFITIENEPRQIINEKYAKNIFEEVSVDLVDEYLAKEANSVFDLQKDALFYSKLINQNILFINIHHIISDGWSIGVLIAELGKIYTALLNNKEPSLVPLGIQYKDYTYWQNSLLEDPIFLDQHQQYWYEHLQNPTTLNFPLDFSRTANQTFNGDVLKYVLNKNLTDKIKNLSKDATLFMTLLTISNILLSKYSSQDDIIVGSPVANRDHEDLRNQIGFYVNTLALRTKLNQSASFEETLRDVKNICLEAFSHQQYPFDKLVDELELDRDLSQNPLFNIMIILQNNEIDEIKFDTLKSTAKPINTKSSKLDITFNYMEVGETIELSLEYNTDLFKALTIERLFFNLETLIESIELSKTLDTLMFVSHDEQTLLKSFNTTEKKYPKKKTIIEVFEKVVKNNKKNVALYCEDRILTYQTLNKKANVLGRYLYDQKKIQRDTIVPIICERSEWMIIALLGVLKSGGAYLPIDASYPKARIEYILKNSQAKILLTDAINREKMDYYGESLGIEVIDIKSTIKAKNFKSEKQKNKNLKHLRNSSDLAYMIYTSGTTGMPKGTMIENSAFVNMILYQIESFNITEENRVIQFASFSFDASVYETFLALLAGASYVLVKKDDLLNNFTEISQKYSVNTAVLNPTFLANIEELDNFKTIITAGEKAIVHDALKYAKKCDYINAYGPTEVSICSSFYKVNPDKNYQSIPIGRPIANIQNFILNEALQQLPIGAVGEIYSAGVGLARGYYNQAKLSSEKFIEHPTLGRIYKTGDIAKYNHEGNLEYLGREDNQVKIRGHRVELSEIDNIVLSHGHVKEAVTLLFEGELVIYLVGEEIVLDKFLKEKLPDFMIPKYMVWLKAFPLTANGKVDTKAFNAPTVEVDHKVEPQTPLEIELCQIYEDVLGVEVGIEDSFFLFGGDSIKAIQISSRLMSLGYKMDIKDLFKYPKIREIIPFIVKHRREISQQEVRGDIALTPIQKWFFDLEVEDKSHFNQDLLLEVDGKIKNKKLTKIIKKLFVHHDVLRTSYQNNKLYNHAIEDIEVNCAHYKIIAKDEIKEITRSLAESIELENAPLIKFAIIESEHKNYFYMVAHHLIIDAVSWRILVEDLTTLYHKQTLPFKTNSFKAYVNALENVSQKAVNDEFKFWESRNFDFLLPTDYVIEKRINKNLLSLSFQLDKAITQDILHNINFAYNTNTQDILLMALNLALFKSFGLEKSIVAMESHGREEGLLDLNLSRTVGWFTALYPVLIEYRSLDLSSQIKIQKEHLREIPNNGIGYGISKYLQHNNLNFSKEILFNYLGQYDDENKSLFTLSKEETTPLWGDEFISEFKLDISVVIINQELQFKVQYEVHEYEKKSIESFVDNYKHSLLKIVEHCKSKSKSELTPDDIDDKTFDVNSLNDFLSNLDVGEASDG